MKIGFSFGKCVRDIAAGVVDIADVVVVVARTNVDREHLGILIESYHRRHLFGDMDLLKCVEVAHQLWDHGKIHQPRKFEVYPGLVVADEFVWMDIVPTVNSDNASVMAAWKTYRMLLKLADGQTPDTQEAERQILMPGDRGF